MKHPHLKRRLITAATLLLILVVFPCIWIERQYRQEKLTRALIAAIKQANVVEVDRLLDSGVDPSTRDTPPMHESIVSIISHLIHPPPPRLSPTALLVALHAPENGFEYEFPPATLQIVTSLLRHKADVNAADKDNNRPITALFVQDQELSHESRFVYPADSPQLLETIIKAHADMEAPGPFGRGPLSFACQCGRTTSVEILIRHGYNVNRQEEGTDAPLVVAIVFDQTEIAHLLVDHGANMGPKPGPLGTPLQAARKNHDNKMITFLKAHGAKE